MTVLLFVIFLFIFSFELNQPKEILNSSDKEIPTPSYNYYMTTYWDVRSTSREPYAPDLASVPEFYSIIHVGFGVITIEGNITFDLPKSEQKQFSQDVKDKQQNGTRVFLSIGGSFSFWSGVKSSTISKISSQILDLVILYGFNGVDFNHQKMSSKKEETSLINLVQALDLVLPEGVNISLTGEDLYISNVTSKDQGGWNTFETVLDQVGNLTEFVQIMAFSESLNPVDVYKDWASGFNNTALTWGGYPSSQLLLGLPVQSTMSGYITLQEALSDVTTLKQMYNIDVKHFFGGLMTWNSNSDEDASYGTALDNCLFEDVCSTQIIESN